MNRTVVLIKLALKQLVWQMARTFGGRKQFSALLVSGAALLLAGLSALYSFAMIDAVGESLKMLVPLSMLSAAFGLMLVFGFYHAQGYLFDFQDYDLLASMPLTQRQILMSKLVALIAMMLLYSAFLTLPMMFLFQWIYAMPPHFLIYGLTGSLFLPLIPLVVSCLIAVAVRRLSSHVKHPTLIRNLLSIAMILGLMGVLTLLQSQGSQAQDLSGLIAPIQRWLAPVYWLSVAMMEGEGASFVKMIGVSAGALGIFLLLITPLWNKLNRASRTSAARQGGPAQYRHASPFKALLRKEIKRYFSSTVLVMNTLVGPILAGLCAVLLIAQQDQLAGVLQASGLDFSAFSEPVAMLLLIVCLFATMISPITATSISLEGKTFWIMRSLPVKTMDYLHAKLLLNLIINVPVCWISIAAIGLVYAISPLIIALLLASTLLAALFTGLYGLAVNLHFARFDYDREITVVKQSMSTMITTITGMLVTFGAACALLFWAPLEPAVMLAVIALALLAAGGLLELYLRHRAEALLLKLAGK